ncbi:MAG: TonB-dependent receptor, partial [Betaproteobacteria bacterium]
PLWVPRLSYTIGFAYANARLTSDFALPANDGYGNIVPGLLSGHSGQQLPGSPKTSLSGALHYDVPINAEYGLTLAANGVYRSAVALQVAPSVGSTTVQHSSTYQIVNLSIALNHRQWRTTLYVTNLFDREEILAPPSQLNQLGNLTNDYLVNPPRQVGLRLNYTY